MNRQAMREKVLGEMVVARDLEIERINAQLAEVKQLNRHQGEKVLQLLHEMHNGLIQQSDRCQLVIEHSLTGDLYVKGGAVVERTSGYRVRD